MALDDTAAPRHDEPLDGLERLRVRTVQESSEVREDHDRLETSLQELRRKARGRRR